MLEVERPSEAFMWIELKTRFRSLVERNRRPWGGVTWCGVVLLLGFLCGCRTADSNFSRIVNEPAPLPENVRAEFGTVGLLPPEPAPDFVFQDQAAAGESFAERTFALLQHTSRDEDHSPPHSHDFDQAQARKTAFASPSGQTQNQPQPQNGSARPKDGNRQSTNHDKTTHQRNVGEQMQDELSQAAGEAAVALVLAGAMGLAEAIVTGVSQGDVRKNQAAVREALKEEPLQSGIHLCLREMAARLGCTDLKPVPQSAWAALAAPGATNRSFPALASSGFKSVLCVQVSSQRFETAGSLNQSLVFVAEADLLVVRAADRTVLHRGTLVYLSRERTLAKWGADHARRLRDEIKQADHAFAESILWQLFAVPVRSS